MRKTIISIVVCGMALAQTPSLTTEQRQAILDYQLTMPRANQLLTAMTAMTKHVAAMPDFKERMAKSMKMTGAERIAQMEKDPEAMSILKSNNLTPREYLIGVPAPRMAILAAQGRSSNMIVASPANVSFAKANLAELKPKMDAADGISPGR
jgi:hypothetical protein